MTTTIKLLAPPWTKYPNFPAGHIFWRMGGGEDYMVALGDWLSMLDKDKRRRYLTSFYEIPNEWLLWAMDWYAYPDDDDDSLEHALEVLTLRPNGNTTT